MAETAHHCEITWMNLAPLREESLYRAWMARMPERRRRKAEAFRFPEGRQQSLGAGILLMLALKRRGIDAARAEISEGPYGKPFLAGNPGLQFSLSHSDEWALCAMADGPVGCDVERIGRGDERLARRFFHPEECAALEAVPDPGEWQRLFARIWTRKESFLKADGRGLNLEMNSFSALRPEPGVRYGEKEIAEGYSFSCCLLGTEDIRTEWRAAEDALLRNPEGAFPEG